MLGGAEVLIGESIAEMSRAVNNSQQLLQYPMVLKDPKRLMRQQQQRGQGVSIIFMLASLDLLDEGFMEVHPIAISPFLWLGEETLLSYLGLYVTYLHLQSAEQSKIELPSTGLIHTPGKGLISSHMR